MGADSPPHLETDWNFVELNGIEPSASSMPFRGEVAWPAEIDGGAHSEEFPGRRSHFRRSLREPPARRRHGYGRAGTRGVTPSTQTGVPREVMVTVALVRPADVASMIDVPE